MQIYYRYIGKVSGLKTDIQKAINAPVGQAKYIDIDDERVGRQSTNHCYVS